MFRFFSVLKKIHAHKYPLVIFYGQRKVCCAKGTPPIYYNVKILFLNLMCVFSFRFNVQVSLAIKRLWSSKTGRCATNTTHGQQHSSSSHGLPSIGESVNNHANNNTNSMRTSNPPKVPMETIC